MTEKENELKEIGYRLVTIRKELHMLQKDFAKEMEISGGSLSEIEAGNAKPRYELLYNITQKYNVNLYYLLHGKGEMFVPDDIEAFYGTKKYGSDTEQWLKNFLYYFNESEMLRYAMMSHFSRFCVENKDVIDKSINKNDANIKNKKGEKNEKKE
jgi:transcriptional regulator with XRE-family HTH domain